ncbi:dihydrolipoyl dehydrogenase [Buchnera aphidicola]|uniref:dihydrolipoyl dehydrogenase n=1 Tax=Buchnera aphidicola TaxID=9 RepID=UPI0034645E42
MVRDIHVQVLVLGSGPAGYSAAFRSSDLGLNTILVEKYNELGGVCLNVGCIPSKFLLHISKVIKESRELSQQGVVFNPPTIDLKKINESKNQILKKLSSGLKYMSDYRKVKILNGIGSFLNENTILVSNENERIHVHFKDVIIATGSKSIKLPNFSIDNKYIWNSTQALSLKKIPKNLLIIGSGIIGLEMATFYSSIGSKVDLIDRCDKILPFLDQDVIDIFIKSAKQDFNFLLNTRIDDIVLENDNIFAIISNGIDTKKVSYDAVLVAIGRSSNIENLNLDQIGVKLDNNNFIIVDQQMRTNISNIYAIGDVVGQPMLAHKGIHQGQIVAEVISGLKHYFDPIAIPSVAYTDPEIAWVGISENEAKIKNIDYEVASFHWKLSGRAIVTSATNGITKLIIHKKTRKIIGGIIVGRQAGELLSEITLAIEMGCHIEDISLTVHPHPTLSESIGITSQKIQGTVTDDINIKNNF